VRVQSDVDRMAVAGTLPEAASSEFVQWLHREFYRDALEPTLHISGAGREFTMTPGEWRSRPEHDVAVGRHQPPSSARVDNLMRYFAQRYRFDGMGRAGRIIAMAAAHHRFNYIHPFPDETVASKSLPRMPQHIRTRQTNARPPNIFRSAISNVRAARRVLADVARRLNE
jgi:hypothetical protein